MVENMKHSTKQVRSCFGDCGGDGVVLSTIKTFSNRIAPGKETHCYYEDCKVYRMFTERSSNDAAGRSFKTSCP